MSKVLKDAALVIGVAAIVVATAGAGAFGAAGVGAATSAATAVGGALGVAGLTAGGLAAGLGLAAAAATFASGALAKKPAEIGNPMQWQSDPQAGIPIVIGRAYTGGKIIYRQAFDKNNVNETINTVFSIGPVKAFEQLYVDGVATSVVGGQAQITDTGKMYIGWQFGAQPEANQLAGTNNPGITVASKMSGLAVDTTTLSYDTTGGHTMTTEPQKGWVIQGVRVYDPRKDDNYSGGSGPQRYYDETTWSYAGYDNPYLAALAWLIGWRQNGKLVAGVGAPIDSIIVGQFVEGSNIADANSWKCGGVLDTTDSKWQRLKDILLAGGGEPIRLGAQIGCLINTPRVSLATIGIGDVVGDASVQATQPMRDRVNAIVPRYMAESSIVTQQLDTKGNPYNVTTVTWGMAAAGPIVVSDYVTFDRGQRQKQLDFEFVQGVSTNNNAPNQVAQLARYAIENAREFGPISLPLKLRWMGYKPGDVVTANLPELGLANQDILLLNRSLDADKGTVTMTARSETAAKHAFALGQTTTAPATPSVSGPLIVQAPLATEWTLTGGTVTGNGQTVPALFVNGATADGVDAIFFELRVYTGTDGDDDNWTSEGSYLATTTSKTILSVVQEAQYQVSIQYRIGSSISNRLILGPVTVGQDSAAQEAAQALASVQQIASDGYISAGQEKRDLLRIVTDIQNEKPIEDAQAAGFGVSASVYDNAYSALMTYLGGLSPAWNDVTQTTAVNPTTLNGRLNDYEYAHVSLVNTVAKVAAQSAVGVNRIKFSQFEKGTIGWAIYVPAPLSLNGFSASSSNGVPYLGSSVNATAANQGYGIYNGGYEFPVTPGERLAIQAGFASANAQTHQLIMRFLAADGTTSVSAPSTQTAATGAFNTKIQFFATVPAGAVSGRLEAYVYSAAGGTVLFNFSQPIVCSVPIGQTTFPPFVPGPNAADGADVTGQNAAAGVNPNTIGRASIATGQLNTASSASQGASATVAYNGGNPTVLAQTGTFTSAAEDWVYASANLNVTTGANQSAGSYPIKLERSLNGGAWTAVTSTIGLPQQGQVNGAADGSSAGIKTIQGEDIGHGGGTLAYRLAAYGYAAGGGYTVASATLSIRSIFSK